VPLLGLTGSKAIGHELLDSGRIVWPDLLSTSD
jgi:hypothetical protein